MYKEEKGIQHVEEVSRIIIKERGSAFWEEFFRGIEKSQSDNFIEGYKYAMRLLEDGLKG